MRHRVAELVASSARKHWGYYALFSLAFAAILVTAVQTYRAIDRELAGVALSRRAAVAQLTATALSEKFERVVYIGISLAARPRVHELVAEGKWVEASGFLRTVPKDLPLIDRLLLVDVEGTLKADVPEAPEVRGTSFAFREWYQGVSRDWRPYVSSVYKRTAAPQVNVFAVAVPIRNASGGVSGILVLQVRVEQLLDWVRATDVDPQEYIYVVDSKGHIAFHSRYPDRTEPVDFSHSPIVQKVRRGEHSVEIGFDPLEREDVISAYAPVPGYGWGVIMQQPTRASVGLAAKDQQLNLLLIAYGLILLLSIAAIYSAARIVIQRRQAEEDRRTKAELETANQLLRESEARYRYLFDNMLEGFAYCRMVFEKGKPRDFVYLKVNGAFEQLTGLKNVVGNKVTEVIPGIRESNPELFEIYGSVVRTGEPASFESYVDALGIWFSISAYRPEEGHFVAVFNNITERKRAEEGIHQLNVELEQRVVDRTRQLEATNKELEAFSYSVSHDLRSPLRAIDGFSRILQEDHSDKLSDEGRRLLGVIRDSSRNMGRLIDDLLEFSRLGRKPLSIGEIDMKHLVEGVLRELQAAGERPRRLVLGAMPPAPGDATLLRQAWLNLLDNAIKFSGKRERPVIEVSGHENGVECVYCVKDNGVGFDMQYYDKLFGVFQRLHSEVEFRGTGVGLAIVQRVITRHGGRVWAEGKVNEGATFYFALPKGGGA
jgi:signal transduction histidine kinase